VESDLTTTLSEVKNDVMTDESPIRTKSYALALRIVHLCHFLVQEKREYVMSRQLLKSGTSIGANIEEAQQGQSRRDFTSKCSIALKEAYETRYWLRLLRDSQYIQILQANDLIHETDEVIRLLVIIIKTAKWNERGRRLKVESE
jgi:four helix bundle protein